MIHFFNRRKLITTLSDQQLYRIMNALANAGIPYRTKSGMPALSASRYHGTPFIENDASHPADLFVKTADYARAKATSASVL